MLGIPGEIVDATEHLLRVADDWRPRRVDLGLGQRPPLHLLRRRRARRQRGRARRRHPRLKARFGAVLLHLRRRSPRSPRRYLVRPPRLVRRGRRPRRSPGVTAIVQNGDALHLLQRAARSRSPSGVALDDGTLAGAVLRARRPARHADRRPGARSRAAPRSPRHRRVDGFAGAASSSRRARSTAGRSRCRSTATTSARCEAAEFAIRPGALTVDRLRTRGEPG